MRITESRLRNICRKIILEFTTPLLEIEVLMYVQDCTDSRQAETMCREEDIIRSYGKSAISILENHPDIKKYGNESTGFWYKSLI